MSTSTLPQQTTCPWWCSDHDVSDEYGALVAHEQQLDAPGFNVAVQELVAVTAPHLGELPGAHVRVVRSSGNNDEHAYLTADQARHLARVILRAAAVADPVPPLLTAANLGRTLAAAAESAGTPLDDLALEVGISPKEMHNRLDGRRPLYLSDLLIICHKLGIQASDLAERAEMLASWQ